MAEGFVKSRSWADDGELAAAREAGGMDPAAKESADGNPSPEVRAQFVVKRLEQFIREGRTIAQGMPFGQWQAMARAEIANAIIAAENSRQQDDVLTKRLLFVAASALVTIGFWGTLLAFDRASYAAVAVICGGAGLFLFAVAAEWRMRKLWKGRRADKRGETLRRVENLTRRIKRMERELKEEARFLEKSLEKAAETKRRLRHDLLDF